MSSHSMFPSSCRCWSFVLVVCVSFCQAWTVVQQLPTSSSSLSSLSTSSRTITTTTARRTSSSSSPLFMATTVKVPSRKPYEPKWKKKATLADQLGKPTDLREVGLKGTVPVVFRQGNSTRTTMALPGQPLREVAIQAGQFIKYGCGKGQCGTCEALVNGQWIRPCSTVVPGNLELGQQYVVQVKDVKAQVVSSGKFFSLRSFLLGFWNNLLGMVGLVLWRKKADRNWQERLEYENLIKRKTMERKQQKNGGWSATS